MKWYRIVLASPVVAVAMMLASKVQRTEPVPGDYFYAIETGGVLCGYSVLDTSLALDGGAELIRLEQTLFSMTSLLGSDVNTEGKLTYILDPETKRTMNFEGVVTQGQIHMTWELHVEGGEARCSSSLGKDNVVVDLPPDAVLENTLFFDHIVRDFVEHDLDENSYKIFEVRDQEIQESTYTRHGTEKLELAGVEYDAVIVDKKNQSTGTLARMWIDTKTAMVLKIVEHDGRVIYLSDESVVRKIERVNMDEYIMSKTTVAIADVPGITYMRVQAKIRPIGLRITPEGLNVPGQTFTGTVEDNLIEGVFEIEHPHYDGTDAPPFPPDFSGNSELREYLEADGIYESDDSVLVEKARELTAGSRDSWQAARRLSEWVSENITYAIPGGGTARKTYDIRAGECGAHSILLAVFCRSVGIPARMVWGCMYSPNFGGAFGQHGWTEVYMGPAGWIPVDATVAETEFVDSGHIRIGDYGSFGTALNAKHFEILEYKIGDVTAEEMQSAADRYAPYVGEYRNAGVPDAFEILVKDGSLALNIPSRLLLALADPDTRGRWYSTMAKQLYCTFDRDESGTAVELQLHELVPMKRESALEETDDNVPDDLRPYLGVYRLAALNVDFMVQHKDGDLAIYHSIEKRTFRLNPPDEAGGWASDNGRYAVYFEHDDENNVVSLTIDAASKFKRQ